jgi:hypothetical protein
MCVPVKAFASAHPSMLFPYVILVLLVVSDALMARHCHHGSSFVCEFCVCVCVCVCVYVCVYVCVMSVRACVRACSDSFVFVYTFANLVLHLGLGLVHVSYRYGYLQDPVELCVDVISTLSWNVALFMGISLDALSSRHRVLVSIGLLLVLINGAWLLLSVRFALRLTPAESFANAIPIVVLGYSSNLVSLRQSCLVTILAFLTRYLFVFWLRSTNFLCIQCSLSVQPLSANPRSRSSSTSTYAIVFFYRICPKIACFEQNEAVMGSLFVLVLFE